MAQSFCSLPRSQPSIHSAQGDQREEEPIEAGKKQPAQNKLVRKVARQRQKSFSSTARADSSINRKPSTRYINIAARRTIPCTRRLYADHPNWQPSHLPTPLYGASTQRERQVFHQFYTESGSQFAGAFTAKFWTVDVPHAAQVYPAIWHAAIAVVAMHKRLHPGLAPGVAREQYAFALHQYNRSIQHVVKTASQTYLTHSDQEMLLLANILFTGISTLSGNLKEATTHINNGLVLFYHWNISEASRQSSRNDGILDVASLSSLFHHLEIQSVMEYSPSAAILAPKRKWIAPPPSEPSKRQFTSVTDAYVELEPILNGYLNYSRPDGVSACPVRHHPTPNVRLQYRQMFSRWKAKFLYFLNTENYKAEDDREGMLILRLWLTCAEIGLHANSKLGLLAFDEFDSAFWGIVDLAQQLLSLRLRHWTAREDKPCAFYFTPSALDPMWFAGSGCRNSAIRRKLIHLMRNWPERDGIGDMRVIAAMVEAKMKFEESAGTSGALAMPGGCKCVEGTFICESHRVFSAPLEVLEEGVGRVTYTTHGDMQLKRPPTLVTITW